MGNKINSLSEYFKEYEKSIKNPRKFWEEIANEFIWIKKWDKVLDFESQFLLQFQLFHGQLLYHFDDQKL